MGWNTFRRTTFITKKNKKNNSDALCLCGKVIWLGWRCCSGPYWWFAYKQHSNGYWCVREALSRVIHGLFPVHSSPVPQLPQPLTPAQRSTALARVKQVAFALYNEDVLLCVNYLNYIVPSTAGTITFCQGGWLCQMDDLYFTNALFFFQKAVMLSCAYWAQHTFTSVG